MNNLTLLNTGVSGIGPRVEREESQVVGATSAVNSALSIISSPPARPGPGRSGLVIVRSGEGGSFITYVYRFA